MIVWLATVALAQHPFDLVRVDDPTHPDAVAVSATGAVLLAPPAPGTPWEHEAVPHVDTWIATEAIEAMNVADWHLEGATGAGVRVAVFDLQWFGAEIDPDELGEVITHDCWAHPSCEAPLDTFRPRFGFEEGVHGYACAEVIHDLAPDAELHLVRVNGGTTLENAADWAIREGIDVVSLSMSFFNTSFYDGSGRTSRQAEKLHDAGILLVASSGNYARAHWEGTWVDADLDGRMDFDGGNALDVYLPAGSSRGVYLNWNQHRTCGLTDLDARLVDSAGRILGRSEDRQDLDADRCSPVERLTGYVAEDGWYRVEVRHVGGPVSGLRLDLIATSGSIGGAIPEGSTVDPGSSPLAFTVGAVRADGYAFNDVESFSSWGPTAGGDPKPDIAGPDGITTAAYGSVGFYGTSAATPAVAGLVAVVMSSDPSLTPHQAARRVQGWALTDAATWEQPDPRWGAGKARLPVEVGDRGCGRRPLLLPLFLPPLAWLRRRRRPDSLLRCAP